MPRPRKHPAPELTVAEREARYGADNTFLHTEDAAAVILKSPATLVQWRREGIGPRYRRVGDKHAEVMYRLSDLQAWFEAGVVETDQTGTRERWTPAAKDTVAAKVGD